MSKNTKVIYTAGSGRSGSTILELLLNNFDSVWTMGEVKFAIQAWAGQHSPDRKCGCSQPLKKCPFWQQIKKSLKSEDFQKGLPPTSRTLGALEAFIGKDFLNKKDEYFCRINTKIFDSALLEATNIRNEEVEYLVDASKSARRLTHLKECDNLDLFVIHLIRDPRAFVNSVTKQKSKLGKVLNTPRQALKYLLKNKMVSHAKRDIPHKRKTVVYYEDMASRPEETMKQIASDLSLEFNPSVVEDFRKRENHGFMGNPSRFRDEDIYLNEEWKDNLPELSKKITKMITYPWAKKHGYFN